MNIEVKVGQVWVDRDARRVGRELTVLEVTAPGDVRLSISPKRWRAETLITSHRLRTSYRLLREAPGVEASLTG